MLYFRERIGREPTSPKTLLDHGLPIGARKPRARSSQFAATTVTSNVSASKRARRTNWLGRSNGRRGRSGSLVYFLYGRSRPTEIGHGQLFRSAWAKKSRFYVAGSRPVICLKAFRHPPVALYRTVNSNRFPCTKCSWRP